MKPLLFTLIFFISITCYSQFDVQVHSTLRCPQAIIYANKIAKEEVYTYRLNKRGIKDSLLSAVYIYDSLGNIIMEKIPAVPGRSESITNYSNDYDAAGRLHRTVSDNAGIIQIREFDYDDMGREINEYYYDKDTISITIQQKIYNEKGQLIQLQTKLNNADFYVSQQYYCNAEGDLITTKAFDKTGKNIFTYTYEYDKSLNKKTVYVENVNGIQVEGEYYYNQDKQCITHNSTGRKPKATIDGGATYVNVDYSSKISYNKDKTIFEEINSENGEVVLYNRHFYHKQL